MVDWAWKVSCRPEKWAVRGFRRSVLQGRNRSWSIAFVPVGYVVCVMQIHLLDVSISFFLWKCFHIIGSVPDAATICSFFQVSKCPWLLKLRVQASEIGDDGGGYVFDSERRLAISGRDTCRAPCCTV